MLNSIKKLFGLGAGTNYAQLVQQGAIIVDVRSKAEYQSGHIPGSLNIPVDQLAQQLHQLKNKQTPIITCCASGMRSASAKTVLKSKGYIEVYNGGSWGGLMRKL